MSKILLAHGSGGKKSHQLITEVILPHFDNPILNRLDDQGIFTLGKSKVAMSTDSYVVDPPFFAGGDIGKLAVHGTVNDLAVSGARPLYLSVGLILEEGFEICELEKILRSMQEAAQEAEVSIVTGDTKVVPRGSADKIFINTAGIGLIEGEAITGSGARPGDLILINGTIGDHGMAVMAAREKFDVSNVFSDSAPLHGLIREVMKVSEVHAMRDPTRGGVATTLKEIAIQSKTSLLIEEEKIPLHPAVGALCDLLGFDPLFVANEGKCLFFVHPEGAERALAAMRLHPYGKNAAIIGQVEEGPAGQVALKTAIGGKRLLDMLVGQQLPRIC
ncbi:MAG TPA: hydrogenase expression/formation protein HypE [Cyanobacteria bacterium UBA8530]|nr:hydrogenase expression/formation protein HypE [Cyanobacteria bacterium UBA8530]